MSLPFVAVDLSAATAQRIQRLVHEELFNGCLGQDVQPFEAFVAAVEDALTRQHAFTDATGHCVRCGATEPGPCSGGAA
jgi:hypothetical protein